MFTYNPETKILKVQKIPEPDFELNLLEYQLESYHKYLSDTIYSDFEYLLEVMREKLQVSQVDAKITSIDLVCRDYQAEIRKQKPRYYSVKAKFTIDNVTYPNALEILRIPCMDADGIINHGGSRRVVLMQLVPAESVSFDADKKTVAVTLPRRNISIDLDGVSDIRVKCGARAWLPLSRLLRDFNNKEKAYPRVADLFTSPYIQSAFAKDGRMADATISHEMDRLNVYTTYHSPAYKLGPARAALNEALSLNRARGRILSRAVGPYEKGTRVDDEVLAYMRRNFINELYVEALPDVVGYTLGRDIFVRCIPKGTTNNSRLREVLPQYRDYSTIPEDCIANLIIPSKESLTMEDILLCKEIGAEFIECAPKKSAPLIRVTFEEEIVGNCTVQLGDIFGGMLPAGRSRDEWVYYHNNHSLEPIDDSYLNVHDLAALYSLCSHLRSQPDDNFLLDKDQGLLKKVLAANELFSISFQATVPNFVTRYRGAISRGLNRNMLGDSAFFGLSEMWISYMWEHKYLDVADTINPMALVAQTNHLVSGSSAVDIPEKMRLLSMGYYGRICPYETPSGKKLGVTNTRAIGARIVDGILTTPYRRVIKNERGEIVGIAAKLTYMDAREEARFRIGDIASLCYENGKYTNTKVMARVPTDNNQVTVESVDAFSLEFVNAFCEQHLSPTAALVPFAGSDDAVRVTYATNMLKQSILVQGAQVPRVFTSMYRKCLGHSDTYVIRAKHDGYVWDIPQGKLQLTYYKEGGEEEEVDIPIHETAITNKAVNFLTFHVKKGDTFKKGDILADSAIAREGIYSPGVNLFAAYIADGYNYEDAVEVSEHAANQFISISPEVVSRKVHRKRGESIRVGQEYCYRYIPEDGIIARVTRKSTLDTRKVSQEYLRAGNHSGILYRIERDQSERDSGKYNAHLLAFNRLRTGDKMAGRHSNKGTCSIVRKNSEMPCFANGRPLDILLNPCGVPSRMNIGQNFEAYLGFVAYLLDVYIESDSFNGATRGDIKLLLQYVWDLANNVDARAVCSKYPMLPKELHERACQRHAAIQEWAGCFEPNGTARLWNPATGKFLENPVTFGVPYMLKLEHEVNHKIHARAGMLEEDYSQISKQPTEGSSKGGGQKMGEMELVNFAAYGATNFLYETCNASSDNVLARINATLRSLNLPEHMGSGAQLPYAVEAFRYYLEVLGYKLVDDENILPPCGMDASEARKVPDIRGIVAPKKGEEDKTTLEQELRGEFS